MSWTDDRVDILSRLWLEGRSASQIAAALGEGLTRNAVIGKVHRLGLAGRVKAGAPAGAHHDDETPTAPIEMPAEIAVSRRASMASAAVAEATIAQMTQMAQMAPMVQGNTALAMAEAPAEAVKPVRAPDAVVVPMSIKVTIVELRETMCKWPIGDPSSSEFRYCGSPSHTGTPYCQHHGKLAYQPAQDRRRERDRDRRTLLAR